MSNKAKILYGNKAVSYKNGVRQTIDAENIYQQHLRQADKWPLPLLEKQNIALCETVMTLRCEISRLQAENDELTKKRVNK